MKIDLNLNLLSDFRPLGPVGWIRTFAPNSFSCYYRDMTANQTESPCSTGTLIPIGNLPELLVNLSRSAFTGFMALVLSISASGSWVNWNNVIPLFAFLICIAIGTHIIERLFRKTRDARSNLWAALAYTFGAAAGIAVFFTDRNLGWFGHFTGV